MKRRLRIIVYVLLAFAAGYFTARSVNRPAAGTLPIEYDPVAIGLRGRFADVHLKDATVKQATQALSELYRIKIDLQVEQEDQPASVMSIDLLHSELEPALNECLKKATDTWLYFDVEGDHLIVFGHRNQRRKCVTRLYDIQPLIELARTGDKASGQTQVYQPYYGAEPDDRTESVIRLVMSNVATGDWMDNGGELGDLTAFDTGILSVHTSRRVHKEVAEFLNDLMNGRAVLKPTKVGRQ